MSQIPWSSHRVLLREIELSGHLVAEGPLRVGAGREPPLGSAVDLAVLRIRLVDRREVDKEVYREVPYIPGSSLKGVFRSTATQLAEARNLRVCRGLSRETCMDRIYPEFGNRTLLNQIQFLMMGGRMEEAVRTFHDKSCLLCKMFGAPSFTGHVEFSDAYPIGDAPVGVRTGIAIDRRTGAVHAQHLYQVEYVEPGARFKLRIRGSNLPNYSLGLLSKTLRMINEGWVRIGGFKTRGFGEVRVENLGFAARGITIQGTKLAKMDEYDVDVDLTGLVSMESGWIKASDENAWKVLAKLEGAWEHASFG